MFRNRKDLKYCDEGFRLVVEAKGYIYEIFRYKKIALTMLRRF